MTEKKHPSIYTPSPTLRPTVGPILSVIKETPRTKAFTLSAPEIARRAMPGQFIMVWIPGTDEIPMSISSTRVSDGEVEFAVAKVGDATTVLHTMKKGQLLGIRGPLGQGFRFPTRVQEGPLLLVGGGCGTPPLLFAAEFAASKGFKVHVALGAKIKAELLFYRRFRRYAETMMVATDDGSFGIKGTAVDATKQLIDTNPTYVTCFACGPEGLLSNLVSFFTKYTIPLQVSLERYMKCGVGICGHCIIDKKGTRVCHEGPVFNAKDLKNTDFGKWTRDETGKRQLASIDSTSCAI
ncbi:MAG: dihydroorotate dehydrogenase electron transfer subunit [Candidatus Thorarchaeota archaeon]